MIQFNIINNKLVVFINKIGIVITADPYTKGF